MRRSFLCAFALVTSTLAGCGGTTTAGPDSSTRLKSDAARKAATGDLVGDPCAANHWYGDGVCDTFCPDKQTEDTDCQPGGEPVVCAAISEVSDGKCGRKNDDPCRGQDPDCTVDTPDDPGTPSDPGDPTYCAAISEAPDGKCGRPLDEPCRFQDPDCGGGGGPGCTFEFQYADGVCSRPPGDPCRGGDPDCDGNGAGAWNCDTSSVTCATLVAVTCPEGQAVTAVNGCYGPCVPKSDCMPIACPAIALAPDGVCSPQPDGPCAQVDPDCMNGAGGGSGAGGSAGGGVACAEFIEQPNGVCSRSPADPCRFQDPDCAER